MRTLFARVSWLLLCALMLAACGRKEPTTTTPPPAPAMEQLDRLVADARPHLPAELGGHLDSVRASVAEVLPRLMKASSHDTDLYTVRETVMRYLPETLANYVALPPVFRNRHPVKEGKTAKQLLGKQLALLDEKMREIVANVASQDAQALLANGRFLETKFRQPDFLAT